MDIKIIELKKSILEDNDRDADRLREQLQEEGTYYVNVMSSPGSGKTTLLTETILRLQRGSASGKWKIGVMEADIDSDVDARTVADKTGVPAVQLHTGGMCHLDADMSRQGLSELGSRDLDLVFLENVGNLVCPAEFDTGAVRNVVILSVPEGDDKPQKYPLMFTKADAVVVTKTDAMEAFDFRQERFCEHLKEAGCDVPVFFLSAVSGEGMEDWCQWLTKDAAAYLEGRCVKDGI